ncbi:C45 family autoproteolytic acyltransferase/hydolase [Serratia sp. 22264]|uniref:C45 family autoproteolytic acyltransferase/hydolase n=1 Tax=Serratia sp. 22264 TaxID=3453897 RepID=UPI003F87CAA6
MDCFGNGLARGHAHGESARNQVRDALSRWAEHTLLSAHQYTDIDAYVRRFITHTGLLSIINRCLPDLVEEVRGIAQGAGLPFEHVLVYNFMDEQWWYDLPQPAETEPGCSLLAIDMGSEKLLAQNMDLPTSMNDSQVLLRIKGNEVPETLLLSAAGMIGLTGVNRDGVGICINTLLMLRHNPAGIPVTFALRHALKQPTRVSHT